MNTTVQLRHQTVDAWDGTFQLRFEIAGSGPPLLYLHPAGGLAWDSFLLDLTDRFTVYAPIFPGTDPSDTMPIHRLDDIHDVVLAYEGALRALGLHDTPVIGQSFGGMIAAELAATFPRLFSAVILLAPGGLWTEDAPWDLDFLVAPPEALPHLLFKDPHCEAARTAFAAPESPEEALNDVVNAIWRLGCVAKFLWPVPDRGLSRRLHRVSAPTLVVWGADDAIVPSSYAAEFQRLIPNCRVEIIDDCGHVPQAEKLDTTCHLVSNFLLDVHVAASGIGG